MTPFQLRKRLKSLALRLLGAEPPSSEPGGASVAAGGPPSYKRDTPVERPVPGDRPTPSIGATAKEEAPSTASAKAPAAAAKASPPVEDESQGSTWVQAGKLDALIEGEARGTEVMGTAIALYNVEGTIYATAGECGHAYGPLAEGVLEGHKITCPLHGWEWDVRDGSCMSGDDAKVRSIPVKIKQNRVMVKV